MQDLKSLRDGWKEVEEIETHLLRQMTVQASLADWLALQKAFEFQLKKTELLFAAERRAALAELQSRLHRLTDWQNNRG